MTLVSLDRVRRAFAGRAETVVAVDGVTLSLDAGEHVGLAGPSGSGKTTLLHLVLGWEQPDGGRVEFDDAVATTAGWSGRAVVPQEIGLLPELTAGQNVELAARLSRTRAYEPLELYERLLLEELVDRLPDELSLGEQQRFAVARAVVAGPRLLVADEPTAHQDEDNADRVMALLTELARSGRTVLTATHDERVLAAADRVVRMIDGHIVGS